MGQALAEVLQILPENVQIFSVGNAEQQISKALNVWFVAHGSPYYKAEKLHGYVAANKDRVRRFSLYTLEIPGMMSTTLSKYILTPAALKLAKQLFFSYFRQESIHANFLIKYKSKYSTKRKKKLHLSKLV